MGQAVFWAEGLAVALLALALALRWLAARPSVVRAAWAALVFLAFAGPAALAAHAFAPWQRAYGGRLATDLFAYSLSWLAAFALASAWLTRRALRRPEAGLGRAAGGWPRKELCLGLGGAALALALTLWNLNLSARADLAAARLEAGDLLLATAAPVGDGGAERLLGDADRLMAPIPEAWRDAVLMDGQPQADWRGEAVGAFVAKHEPVLASLRKAAATPPGPRPPRVSLSDPQKWVGDIQGARRHRDCLALLAIDARAKAARGEVARAFEDISAILALSRHIHGLLTAPELMRHQFTAWRALEDVLRLAPAGQALPGAAFAEVMPPLRILRLEMARMGMIFPSLLADDPLRFGNLREGLGPLAEPPLVWLIDAGVTPAARAFLSPAELRYSREKWEAYRAVMAGPPDGAPRDWQAARAMIHDTPAGWFSAVWIKPKEMKLLRDAGRLAALGRLAQAGLAAARYREKHGRYPERLEQLVPALLPAMPTDPRDGQPLRMRRFAEGPVLYTAADSGALDGAGAWEEAMRKEGPVFRLPPRGGAK